MPPRMIEVNDGYAVMPKAPRPAAPRLTPPAKPAPTPPPVAPPSAPIDDTPQIPAGQPKPNQPTPRAPTAPAPEPRPVQRPEYADDTPDIPRGGQVSNRRLEHRPVGQASQVPAELIAVASYNPVAQCMVQILRHEPVLFGVVLRASASFQDALNKLIQEAGKDDELDEEVVRILQDAPEISDKENYGTEQRNYARRPTSSNTRIAAPSPQPEPNFNLANVVLNFLDEHWLGRNVPTAFSRLAQGIILDMVYDVDLTSDLDAIGGYGDWRDWSAEAVNEVYQAVITTGRRLSDYEGQTATYVSRGDPASAFRTAMGPVEILLSPTLRRERDGEIITWSAETIAISDEDGTRRNRIEVYSQALPNQSNQQEADWFEYNLVHEFGHVFNNRLRGNAVNALALDPSAPPDEGWDGRDFYNKDALPFGRQSPLDTYGEIWADQFLFWIYDSFNKDTLAGGMRDTWMQESIAGFINAAARRNYSATELLKVPEIAGHVVTNGMNLNLWSRTDQSSPESSIPTGARVEVLGRDSSGEWIAVAYGSSIGWVRSEFLQVNVNYVSEISQERIDYATGRSLVDSQPEARGLMMGHVEAIP